MTAAENADAINMKDIVALEYLQAMLIVEIESIFAKLLYHTFQEIPVYQNSTMVYFFIFLSLC